MNICFAALLYFLALRYGRSIHTFLLRELCTSSGTDSLHHFLCLAFDVLTSYIFFTALTVLILLPLISHKGLVLNILGYTFFYWFLFFPLHLLVDVARNEVWPQFYQVGMAIFVITVFMIFATSLFYFPNSIKRVYLNFKTSKIDNTVRIVHLSDVHIENFGQRETHLISIVNELYPDVILISGDLLVVPCTRSTKSYRAAMRLMEILTAKYGIYIVEGHHDINEIGYIADAFKTKVKVLRNEWHHFGAHGIKLSLFGARLRSRKTNFAKGGRADDFRIFLAHGPALVKTLTSSNFDLALFGHTHASQVYLPFISYLLVGKYRHGLYNYKNIPFYVNSGIGLEGYCAPRIRWLTFPEVVVIDLIPKGS